MPLCPYAIGLSNALRLVEHDTAALNVPLRAQFQYAPGRIVLPNIATDNRLKNSFYRKVVFSRNHLQDHPPICNADELDALCLFKRLARFADMLGT